MEIVFMLDLLIGTSCPSLPLGIVEWKNNTLVTVRFEHEIYFALLEKSITKQYQRLHYRYGVRTGRDATQFKMYLFSDLMMIGNVENSLEPAKWLVIGFGAGTPRWGYTRSLCCSFCLNHN